MNLRIFVAAVFLGISAFAGDRQPKIVLLGDSTVANYDAKKTMMRGWGQFLAEQFQPGVTVVNLAKGGRSTKTFKQEGWLDKALAEKADVALIQFGHNDSHAPDRPEATNAQTDFKANLRDYIAAFRHSGTEPVLVTPMHRRTFQDGRLTTELEPYAQAMREVAAELKTPLIDLQVTHGELLTRLGEAGGEDLFYPKDRTHFSEKGARAVAALVGQGIASNVPALKTWLKPGS